MNSGAEFQEKRGAPRLRALKGARLILANHASTFQCTVRNISQTGMLVEMPSTLTIPSRVRVRLDDGSPERMCDVIWRTETRLGLRFF